MPKHMLTVLLVFCFIGLAHAESTYHLNESGIDAYAQGEYGLALEKFGAAKKQAEDKPQLDYNMGATWAKDGALEKADEAFDKAAQARNDKLRARAMQAKSSMHYDAAWSNYQEAQETGSPSKHDAAVQHTQSALEAARKALLADPTDEAARINYELAMRLQKKLEEKEKSDQQDDQEKDKNEEEKQDERQQQQKKEQQNKEQQKPSQDQQEQSRDEQSEQQQNEEQKQPDQKDPKQQQKQEQNTDEKQSEQEQQAAQQDDDQKGEPMNATLNLLDTIEDNDEEALQMMLRGRRANMPEPEKDW